jgi:hypothetical protein
MLRSSIVFSHSAGRMLFRLSSRLWSDGPDVCEPSFFRCRRPLVQLDRLNYKRAWGRFLPTIPQLRCPHLSCMKGPLVAAPVKIVIRSGSAISWYSAATRFGVNMRKQLGSILFQPAYVLSVAP